MSQNHLSPNIPPDLCDNLIPVMVPRSSSRESMNVSVAPVSKVPFVCNSVGVHHSVGFLSPFNAMLTRLSVPELRFDPVTISTRYLNLPSLPEAGATLRPVFLSPSARRHTCGASSFTQSSQTSVRRAPVATSWMVTVYNFQSLPIMLAIMPPPETPSVTSSIGQDLSLGFTSATSAASNVKASSLPCSNRAPNMVLSSSVCVNSPLGPLILMKTSAFVPEYESEDVTVVMTYLRWPFATFSAAPSTPTPARRTRCSVISSEIHSSHGNMNVSPVRSWRTLMSAQCHLSFFPSVLTEHLSIFKPTSVPSMVNSETLPRPKGLPRCSGNAVQPIVPLGPLSSTSTSASVPASLMSEV